jgi:hypothetical protein
LFDNPNCAINTLVGIFGHNYESRNVRHFTQDNASVLNELSENKDTIVNYDYKYEFISDIKDNQSIDMNKFNPDDQ